MQLNSVSPANNIEYGSKLTNVGSLRKWNPWPFVIIFFIIDLFVLLYSSLHRAIIIRLAYTEVNFPEQRPRLSNAFSCEKAVCYNDISQVSPATSFQRPSFTTHVKLQFPVQ